jgi:hypothetical protein
MMQSDWPSVLYILDTTLLTKMKLLLYTFGCSEPFVIMSLVFCIMAVVVLVQSPSAAPNGLPLQALLQIQR